MGRGRVGKEDDNLLLLLTISDIIMLVCASSA
jgi:hypothetical protein